MIGCEGCHLLLRKELSLPAEYIYWLKSQFVCVGEIAFVPEASQHHCGPFRGGTTQGRAAKQ